MCLLPFYFPIIVTKRPYKKSNFEGRGRNGSPLLIGESKGSSPVNYQQQHRQLFPSRICVGRRSLAITAENTDQMIPIYVMGKEYTVPASLTVQKALEYSGFQYIRGCGCRGGVCGACGIAYRIPGSYKLRFGLACQTVVETDMSVFHISFYPANKALYSLDDLKPTAEQLVELYPELMRCVQCNTCTKTCPQDIEVMDYMAAAMRGDIERVAELILSCIMCGLCAARCPAEIVPYYIGLICRRLYGRYLQKKDLFLGKLIHEIEQSKFDGEIDDLMTRDFEELRRVYQQIQEEKKI
jgi:succinate dehydrogenase/fumarate reductase-like Fe-S protein